MSTSPSATELSAVRTDAGSDVDPLPVLQITNWPLRDHLAWTIAAAAVALLLGGLVAWSTGLQWLAIFVTLGLVVVLWRAWVPVRFELDVRGIQQIVAGHRSYLPWTAIVGYEIDPGGILLLREEGELPLSALRGLYIAADQQHAELQELVRFYVDREVVNCQVTTAESAAGEAEQEGNDGSGV